MSPLILCLGIPDTSSVKDSAFFRRYLILCVALFLSQSWPLLSPAFADQPVCRDPDNNISNELKYISGINEQIQFLSEPDPGAKFSYACQSRASNFTKPDVSWFQRSVPASDANAVEAKEFMKALLKRMADIGQENVNISKNIRDCLKPGAPKTDVCSGIHGWIEADGGLKFKVEEARFHLALSQGPNDIYTSQGAPSPNINTKLRSNGVYKHEDWKPLTDEEYKNVSTVFRDEHRAITDELKKKGHDLSKFGGRRIMRDRFLKMRLAHFEEYKRVLETVPFLQFISSANPSDDEISEAARQQGELAEEELKRVRGWLSELEKPDAQVTPEMLQALDYRMLSEEVLLANPKYCGIATGLMEVKEQRQLGNTVGVMAPLVLISFFAPPAAAIGAGVVGSGVMAAQSYVEFDRGRDMALSEVVAEKGAPGPAELKEMSNGVAQELTVGMALNVVGVGVISKGTSAARRTEKVISSIKSREPLPYYAVPEVVKKRPVRDREIGYE